MPAGKRVDCTSDRFQMQGAMPYVFPAGRVPGSREIVPHRNYIVVYRVT
jgi:hypothetical protein